MPTDRGCRSDPKAWQPTDLEKRSATRNLPPWATVKIAGRNLTTLLTCAQVSNYRNSQSFAGGKLGGRIMRRFSLGRWTLHTHTHTHTRATRELAMPQTDGECPVCDYPFGQNAHVCLSGSAPSIAS